MNENNKINQLPNDFLTSKIKYSLALLGMSETYFSFNYLVTIIQEIITSTNTDDEIVFKNSVEKIAKKYNIECRTVRYELIKILNTCTNKELTSKTQYNLKNKGVINKIRVINEYILNTLTNII